MQHGYDPADETASGAIVVRVRRVAGRLRLSVDDDGRGLPAGFDLAGSTSLGLSIVRTLVESELGGGLRLGAAPGGTGTRASLDVPLV